MVKTSLNSRLGNRLSEAITIGCSSLTARVPADEQISAFVFTFGFGFSTCPAKHSNCKL
jgi:hypothetical protein